MTGTLILPQNRSAMTLTLLTTGDERAQSHLLLAHGAGAGMRSPFLDGIVQTLAHAGLCVHRFEFSYMRSRGETGKRRPPPPIGHLCGEFEAAAQTWRGRFKSDCRLLIGGKSMGGRVATMVADRLAKPQGISGVIVFGYPFHPAQSRERTRTAHLRALETPTLIVQGTRDKLGSRDEVMEYPLASGIEFLWIEDGDHDLRARTAGGTSHAEILNVIAQRVVAFAHTQLLGIASSRGLRS